MLHSNFQVVCCLRLFHKLYSKCNKVNTLVHVIVSKLVIIKLVAETTTTTEPTTTTVAETTTTTEPTTTTQGKSIINWL